MSLLRNGAFEQIDATTSAPVDWKVDDWSAPDVRRPVKAVVDQDGMGPDRAGVKIVSDSRAGNLVLFQDIRRPGAGNYVLSVLCKPDAGAEVYASIVALADGKNLAYQSTHRVRDATAWTKLELRADAPSETELVRIILRTNRGASFSDASVVLRDADGSVMDTRHEPSSGKALREKHDDLMYDRDADTTRKAAMSPDELAWEELLEKCLGSFYLPRYKLAKERGSTTAWDFVKDVPGLPRVLLIGDSISRGYTVATRKTLTGKVNVHRAPENCGPTANGLRKLDIWLGDGNWDLIHFNFGIHDQRSRPGDYSERLETIVERLEKTGAKLVFATSTPIPEDAEEYRHGVCAELNEAAKAVMDRHEIPLNDLYALMLPLLDEYQNPGDCHFRGEGYEVMGKQVAKRILEELRPASK